ncbi:MAG: YceI family protein [Bacteroidetes bacterium]|nr:YceI family protein [Bacteroidota bacterium]
MKRSISLLALAILVVGTTQVFADKYGDKSHKMVINGTSTLHDWEAPLNNMKARADFSVVGTELTGLTSFWVECDVTSIKSEKGESMDEKIYEALKSEDNPKIVYNLSQVKSLTKKGSDFVLETVGTLKVAGKTVTIDMTVTAKVNANGEVMFSAEKKLKMSQFDMDRPSAMLGVIKAGDDVTVSFDVTMKKI